MFEGVVGRSCLSDIAIDGIKTETCGGGKELTEVSTLNLAFFHVVKFKKKNSQTLSMYNKFHRPLSSAAIPPLSHPSTTPKVPETPPPPLGKLPRKKQRGGGS